MLRSNIFLVEKMVKYTRFKTWQIINSCISSSANTSFLSWILVNNFHLLVNIRRKSSTLSLQLSRKTISNRKIAFHLWTNLWLRSSADQFYLWAQARRRKHWKTCSWLIIFWKSCLLIPRSFRIWSGLLWVTFMICRQESNNKLYRTVKVL